MFNYVYPPQYDSFLNIKYTHFQGIRMMWGFFFIYLNPEIDTEADRCA